ncbi:MAG: hypothetical protein JW966_10810 [Anaerolineae bacterium]|nr:hypothetical protein [Anaerolineae bacterium]
MSAAFTPATQAHVVSKNGKNNTQPVTELFPAFAEPNGWSLKWDGHALEQLSATSGSRPQTVANTNRTE